MYHELYVYTHTHIYIDICICITSIYLSIYLSIGYFFNFEVNDDLFWVFLVKYLQLSHVVLVSLIASFNIF